MVVLALEATVFGLIAGACSIVGTTLAVLSHVSTKKNAAEEASRECHENLLKEQRRTEGLSKKLRDLRVKYGEAEDE